MDIEQAKALRSSTQWLEIVKEIQREIDAEITKLYTCSSDQLATIQARISAFEKIKALPQNVVDREE